MLDHIGVNVSDYESAKAFYAAALAPLGYTLAIEPIAGVGGFSMGRPRAAGRVPVLDRRGPRRADRRPHRVHGAGPGDRRRVPRRRAGGGRDRQRRPGHPRDLPPRLLRRLRPHGGRREPRGGLPPPGVSELRQPARGARRPGARRAAEAARAAARGRRHDRGDAGGDGRRAPAAAAGRAPARAPARAHDARGRGGGGLPAGRSSSATTARSGCRCPSPTSRSTTTTRSRTSRPCWR